MDKVREIKAVVRGHSTVDGAGVKLVRVIGKADTTAFDPFLMLDAFDSKDPEDYIKGFPWHPHRGIETITYLIKGTIDHGDSLGNKGSIGEGQCQWMTAGSGIIHQEMPKASKHMLGIQLWLNLPANEKMSRPQYHGITAAEIPVVEENGTRIKVISGCYKGQPGAFAGAHIKPRFLAVELTAGTGWEMEIEPSWTAFIYSIAGGGFVGKEQGAVEARQALLLTDGNRITVCADGQGLHFVLLAAPPLRESVAWGGPIVMNTKEELALAFRELDENTFIK